ncbi:MAG: hypothetical protein HY445_02910 [Candidatus Niyogibacteria bacterium]|nr:hypothetical protein [Candidatus Niyogibacteria bacterium]
MDFDNTLIDALAPKARILVITGAGISKASGLDTYRGVGGIWNTIDYEKVATKEAYNNNPKEIAEYWKKMKTDCEKAEPNSAHITLAEMEKFYSKFQIITQNVDELHQRAGSKNVLEIHGSLFRERQDAHNVGMPDIVLYREQYSPTVLNTIIQFLNTIRPQAMIVIGTSCAIPLIGEIIMQSQLFKSTVIEINIEPTIPSFAVWKKIELKGKAEEVLPALWGAIKEKYQNT